MNLSKTIRSLLLCVPALVVLAGCDGSPAEPTAAVPQVQPSNDYTYTWGSLTLVTSAARTLLEISNYAVIGPDGGRLRLGFHELVVPAGAVANATRFSITAKYGASPTVDLKAVDLVTGASVTEFPVNLQLKLSYLLTLVRQDEVDRLVVVWLKDNSASGELVPVPTTHVPSGYYVIGWLTHFSQYSMAMD